MIHDQERRIFLAKMLKIPPALFGLDWRLVASEENMGSHGRLADLLSELAAEESYYHYEDTLTMAWECFYSGGVLTIADRFERRLRKLRNMVQNAPEQDKDVWKGLLGRYLILDMQILQYRGENREQKHEVLGVNGEALKLATEHCCIMSISYQ